MVVIVGRVPSLSEPSITMTSCGLLTEPELAPTALPLVAAGFPSTLVVLGLPFFFIGPINVSAFISLSDSVTGTVDCLTGFGGLILAFARIWIEARVSLVNSIVDEGPEEDEGSDC